MEVAALSAPTLTAGEDSLLNSYLRPVIVADGLLAAVDDEGQGVGSVFLLTRPLLVEKGMCELCWRKCRHLATSARTDAVQRLPIGFRRVGYLTEVKSNAR